MNWQTINELQTSSGDNGALLANRYRVIKPLGHGGMGSVWLAEDTQLYGCKVAIKMLPAILLMNQDALRQLKSEALVSKKLAHPNIVPLRGFEENNGNPFLIMDYIEGQTLDDILAEKGKLSENETIQILKPIAAALDYANAKGVIHRDVKPGNVIVADGTSFLLDFGIAKELQETMSGTTDMSSAGTPTYISPEQRNGDKPSPAQDVYSFAAMAYECIMGVPPFANRDEGSHARNETPTPLPLDIAMSAGVMAGLAKTATARPLNCMAVLTGDGSVRAHGVSTTTLPSGSQSARYCVIDLSAGPNATHYPVSYLDEPDTNIFNIFNLSVYKTTKLVLRRLEPGTFTMGCSGDESNKPHNVTLTKPFFCGIFEVTQKQYELVMGENPSLNKGSMRPVECVCWDVLRGDTPDCNWPISTKVAPDSFMGRLRARTGINFDLPTEAQWEYACRAGTTSKYNNDGDSEDDLKQLGRYWDNQDDGKYGYREHTNVGSYKPNAWGLYDMHGNVFEWCLDWFEDTLSDEATDPVGSLSGSYRALRGSCWDSNHDDCASSNRGCYPSDGEDDSGCNGFRLVFNLS